MHHFVPITKILNRKENVDVIIYFFTQLSGLHTRQKKTYLQISFGGERSAADGAGEGLLSRVGPLVDLQSARGREHLPAGVAVVLLGGAAWWRGRQDRGRGG